MAKYGLSSPLAMFEWIQKSLPLLEFYGHAAELGLVPFLHQSGIDEDSESGCPPYVA